MVRRGPDIHGFLKSRISELAQDHDNTAQIRRALVKEFGEKEIPPDRSLRRYVQQSRNEKPEKLWTLSNTDPGMARQVMDVLKAVVEGTEGRRAYLTCGEAKLIERLVVAAPNIGPWHMWRLARLYIDRSRDGMDVADVDFFVASSNDVVIHKGCIDHAKEAWCMDLVLSGGWRLNQELHERTWPDRPYPAFTISSVSASGEMFYQDAAARSEAASIFCLRHPSEGYEPRNLRK
jgi:hypothetical protein